PAQNNQVAGPPATPPATPPGTPPATEEQARIELMDRIERQVRLPEGADRLETYARSYAWQVATDGHRKVVAYYENLTSTPPGRRWVSERDFPGIADGGCGVVRFTYDPATQQVEQIACNGYA